VKIRKNLPQFYLPMMLRRAITVIITAARYVHRTPALISKRWLKSPAETGAGYGARNATGRWRPGAVRIVPLYALAPTSGHRAMARAELTSRTALIAWAEAHQINVPRTGGDAVLH
jgi:hypothetical protein